MDLTLLRGYGVKRLALLFPLLLFGTLPSTGNPANSPDRRAIAEEFVWRLLRGDYAVGSSIKSVSENQAGFRRSIQGVLTVVGRPVEILSSTESPERGDWVIVDMRCQNESLTLGVRVDEAGSVGNLEVSITPKPDLPITGRPIPQLVSFDATVIDLIKRWNLVGASLAVVKDGRLVFSRGYGFSDLEKQVPVQPNSLFRIASVSKPITSAAVLLLVEQGRLDLDARAFELLESLQPPKGAMMDPRLATITVRQLLWHAGGWDRDKSFDPMFIPRKAADVVGAEAPAGCETVIRYMLGQPLDFDPGGGFSYSNFGYCVLGRIIERVSGQPYEDYVRDHVLKPAGISRMRVGSSLESGRAEREVRYYDYSGAAWSSSLFEPDRRVPWPDGGFYLEAMEAHGGWIASASDLLRFANHVDGRDNPPDILEPTTVRTMIARPELEHWKDGRYWTAMGWLVRPQGEDANWWHSGSLPGTTSLMVRGYHGVSWAILFNTRPERSSEFAGEVDRRMWGALEQVREWPEHDLF